MSIAPYQPTQNGVAVPQQPVAAAPVSMVAQMADWAQSAQAVYQVCEQLQHTSFVPTHYRGKPQEMTAAMLAGMEVGLSQMASLRAFDPIQGSAAPKAITLRAIVLSKGHTLDLVESSATRAVVVGRRNGTGAPQTSVWTMERAELMGLPKKNPNWRTQPEAMLIARATSEAARLTASDAILGIPYSVEELQDGMSGPVQAVAEQTTPPAPPVVERRRNRASVLPAAAAVDEPAPAEQSVAASAGPDPEAPLIDPKGPQMKRLHALMAEKGITDREEALHVASGVVGRRLTSTKDMTMVEASRVIERLVQMPAAEATAKGA